MIKFQLNSGTLVAKMRLKKDGRIDDVEITNPDLGMKEEVVYVWTRPNKHFLRVGTSKDAVCERLKRYTRDINNAFDKNKKSPTPLEEANDWIDELRKYKYLTAYVYQPPEIKIIAGDIHKYVRPYLDMERVIIRTIGIRKDKGKLLNRSYR